MPDNLNRHIIIDVKVGFRKSESLYISITAGALIDTGAGRSCISKQLANELGLQSVKDVDIITATRKETVPHYTGIDLILSNFNGIEKIYKNIEVEECLGNVQPRYDFVIGMDILSTGDMIISNANNIMTFSFRTPSGKTHIRFNIENGEICDDISPSLQNIINNCTPQY